MFAKPPLSRFLFGLLLVPVVTWIAVTPAIDEISESTFPAEHALTHVQDARGFVPPHGFVPDSATAVRIAVAVWIPIYGASEIRSEQPYVARLKQDVWTVTGTLPQGVIGGTAEARIAKRDGRILFVIHSQ